MVFLIPCKWQTTISLQPYNLQDSPTWLFFHFYQYKIKASIFLLFSRRYWNDSEHLSTCKVSASVTKLSQWRDTKIEIFNNCWNSTNKSYSVCKTKTYLSFCLITALYSLCTNMTLLEFFLHEIYFSLQHLSQRQKNNTKKCSSYKYILSL